MARAVEEVDAMRSGASWESMSWAQEQAQRPLRRASEGLRRRASSRSTATEEQNGNEEVLQGIEEGQQQEHWHKGAENAMRVSKGLRRRASSRSTGTGEQNGKRRKLAAGNDTIGHWGRHRE